MTVEDFCRHLARILPFVDASLRVEMLARQLAAFYDVDPHEVGVFQIDAAGRTANFCWPPHSGNAINIPLKTFVTSLVSATAKERRGIVDNQFSSTPHLHMFEHGLAEREQRIPVQRIMSVPVSTADGALRWIIQVTRKGKTMEEAGPAFTDKDLQDLERIAAGLAQLIC